MPRSSAYAEVFRELETPPLLESLQGLNLPDQWDTGLEVGDPVLDADPFFMRSGHWSEASLAPDQVEPFAEDHTSLVNEAGNRRFTLNQPLHPIYENGQFILLAANEGSDIFVKKVKPDALKADGVDEGLFVIRKDEFEESARESAPLPIYFFPLPRMNWRGPVRADDLNGSAVMLGDADGEALPLAWRDVQSVVRAEQVNLLIARGQAMEAYNREHASDPVDPQAGQALVQDFLQLRNAAVSNQDATAASALNAIYQKLGQSLPALNALPLAGSTAGFGVLFTGLDAAHPNLRFPTAPKSNSAALAPKLWQRAADFLVPTARADGEMSPEKMHAFEQELHKKTIHKLLQVGAITAAAVIIGAGLKYTVYRKHFEKLREENPRRRNRVIREVDEVATVTAHNFVVLNQVARITFSYGVEYFFDRYFSRWAAGDNTVLRWLQKKTILFTRAVNNQIPVNGNTLAKGVFGLGATDVFWVSIQLYWFMPHVLSPAIQHAFPPLGDLAKATWASGNEVTHALNNYALLGNITSYVLTGAIQVGSSLKDTYQNQIEVQVEKEWRQLGLKTKDGKRKVSDVELLSFEEEVARRFQARWKKLPEGVRIADDVRAEWTAQGLDVMKDKRLVEGRGEINYAQEVEARMRTQLQLSGAYDKVVKELKDEWTQARLDPATGRREVGGEILSFDDNVEKLMQQKIKEMGLPSKEEFLHDFGTLYKLFMKLMGYRATDLVRNDHSQESQFWGSRRPGLVAPALNKAYKYALELQARYPNDADVQGAVRILRSTRNEIGFVRNGLVKARESLAARWKAWRKLPIGGTGQATVVKLPEPSSPVPQVATSLHLPSIPEHEDPATAEGTIIKFPQPPVGDMELPEAMAALVDLADTEEAESEVLGRIAPSTSLAQTAVVAKAEAQAPEAPTYRGWNPARRFVNWVRHLREKMNYERAQAGLPPQPNLAGEALKPKIAAARERVRGAFDKYVLSVRRIRGDLVRLSKEGPAAEVTSPSPKSWGQESEGAQRQAAQLFRRAGVSLIEGTPDMLEGPARPTVERFEAAAREAAQARLNELYAADYEKALAAVEESPAAVNGDRQLRLFGGVERANQVLRDQHPAEYNMILNDMILMAKAAEEAAKEIHTPAKKGRVERWQLRKTEAQADRAFEVKTSKRFLAKQATDEDRKIWRNAFAEAYSERLGLHMEFDGALKDKEAEIKQSAWESTAKKLEEVPVARYLATLDPYERLRFEAEHYTQFLIGEYLQNTHDKDQELFSRLDPAQPGRLQRLRQTNFMRHSKFLTKAARWIESLVPNQRSAWNPGLVAMLDRNVPAFFDARDSYVRMTKGLPTFLLASYPYNAFVWGMTLTPQQLALMWLTAPICSVAWNAVFRLVHNLGWKPMSNMWRMIGFASVASWVTWFGEPVQMMGQPGFNSKLHQGWELIKANPVGAALSMAGTWGLWKFFKAQRGMREKISSCEESLSTIKGPAREPPKLGYRKEAAA